MGILGWIILAVIAALCAFVAFLYYAIDDAMYGNCRVCGNRFSKAQASDMAHDAMRNWVDGGACIPCYMEAKRE